MQTHAFPKRPVVGVLVAISLFATAACSGTDGGSDRCAGPRVLPHQSPFVFGEAYPRPSKDEDTNPGTFDRTPVARTLLLESQCESTLKIQKSCLVGEKDDDGTSDAKQFSTTGPKPKSLSYDESAAFRITYNRSEPNSGDDIDNVAAVFQTNAKNFPTLVVPVCGRVVKEGTDRKGVIECSSPVQAPPKGKKKSNLCN